VGNKINVLFTPVIQIKAAFLTCFHGHDLCVLSLVTEYQRHDEGLNTFLKSLNPPPRQPTSSTESKALSCRPIIPLFFHITPHSRKKSTQLII